MTELHLIRSDGAVARVRPADRSRCGARRREWLLAWGPPPRRGARTDPRCSLTLRFPSLDAALAYARAEGWEPEACPVPQARPPRPTLTAPLEPPPPAYWWALESRTAAPLAEAA